MTLKRMRVLDTLLGQPLCTALGALVRLARLFSPPARTLPDRPRRILVMKFFGLGSLVQATPMLRAVRQRYPDSTLAFLTFDRTAGLVQRFGLCDEVWHLRTSSLWAFSVDVARQIARFALRRVDVCIDLEFFSKFSTLMSLLSGARVRVAYHLNSFWRHSIVTHPVYFNYHRHVSDAYNAAAAVIGAPVHDRLPQPITIEPALVERARRRLLDAGWNGTDTLIGINVNAGELALERRWPGEYFAALLERLATLPDVRPVLLGAAEEVAHVAAVVAQLTAPARAHAIDLAGRLTFDEFIASLRLYHFVVTNDSGPLHLAYAQGVDTISVWGPGRPDFYGPPIGNHSTFYRSFPCSPCVNMFTCRTGQWCQHRADCMRAIAVDDVWATVEAYLRTPAADRAAVAVRQGW